MLAFQVQQETIVLYAIWIAPIDKHSQRLAGCAEHCGATRSLTSEPAVVGRPGESWEGELDFLDYQTFIRWTETNLQMNVNVSLPKKVNKKSKCYTTVLPAYILEHDIPCALSKTIMY